MALTAADFQGVWALRRTIVDRRDGQNGTLAGQAVFMTTQPDHLTYEETGRLTLESGVTLEAQRRYQWVFAAGAVIVTFEDGRPFHSFTPEGHAAGTDHPCGDDFYTVRYDFTAWPVWRAVWTVKGPRKDYVSTSTYRPL